MKEITLVATDLDGTLLNSDKKVSDFTKETIRKLKRHGILFGIASGRPVESGIELCKDWGLEDSISFLIGMNGGVIYDMRTKEKDSFYLIDGEIIKDIIHSYDDMDVIFHVLVGNDRYTSKSTEETRAHAKLFGEKEIETDLDEFLTGRKVNKLIIYTDPALMPAVEARANTLKSDKFAHCSTANNLYEFMDPHINKGFGIDRVAEHFGVDKEHIVAFGDANNDIQMLKHVGTGVAMKNATKEAKEAATIVSDYTNDEDAEARFINEEIIPNALGYVEYLKDHPSK